MPRGILEVAIVLPAVVSGEVPCPLGSAQREFGEQLFEDLAVFFGDGFGGLAGPGVFLGVDAPLAVVVFEGGAVFDPVPTVQVADAPFAGLEGGAVSGGCGVNRTSSTSATQPTTELGSDGFVGFVGSIACC